MKRPVFYLLLVSLSIMLTNNRESSAQSSSDVIGRGVSGAFFNSFENARRSKERQKQQAKKEREKNPYWQPPKELGVPYLGVELGWSHFKGEHIGLKTAFGGFNVFGGIGKEWIFSNHSDKSLLWYAGCGYFFGDINDGSGEGSIDIAAGQTPLCHDIGILGSFSIGYFFGTTKRIGVKGTLGIGIGNLDYDEPKWLWEFGAGVIIKLWAD